MEDLHKKAVSKNLSRRLKEGDEGQEGYGMGKRTVNYKHRGFF